MIPGDSLLAFTQSYSVHCSLEVLDEFRLRGIHLRGVHGGPIFSELPEDSDCALDIPFLERANVCSLSQARTPDAEQILECDYSPFRHRMVAPFHEMVLHAHQECSKIGHHLPEDGSKCMTKDLPDAKERMDRRTTPQTRCFAGIGEITFQIVGREGVG